MSKLGDHSVRVYGVHVNVVCRDTRWTTCWPHTSVWCWLRWTRGLYDASDVKWTFVTGPIFCHTINCWY